MHVIGVPTSTQRVAQLVIIFFVSAGSAAAQAPRAADPDLAAALMPGTTVWITEAGRREEKMRLVSVSGDIVTTAANGETRRIRIADVRRVRARHSDSVINGALIGAGVAVASGLFVCRLTEPWENCRDDVGPMFRIGAAGAGIGIAIDALIRGRRTLYESVEGSTKLEAAPVIARRGAGVAVRVRF